ncbi:MAG: hypothetical protein LBH76_09755, partial [Propionibacteriaceae bacterium]|nr:hypothetical protein [Propionibacteriaceae bacterium]
MIAPRPPRFRRPARWRTAAALAGLLAAAAVVAAPPAQAAPMTAELTLDALTVTDAGLALDLTVANTGAEPLYGGQVMLWRDQAVRTTPADLQAALDSPLDGGLRLGDPFRDAYHVLGDQRTAFEPGDRSSFTLKATWNELNFNVNGVYLVGADLWASPDARSDGEVVARVRTFVVRPGDAAATRSAFVALTSAPSQVAGDRFADDHLADEFAGRLADLAKAAGRPGVGWLLDPAVYAAAEAMADGYEVGPEDGAQPGAGAEAAAAWLALVHALPRGNGFRTLWGDPDLALGAALGDAGPVERSAAALTTAAADDPALAQLALLPLAVWLPQGAADAAFLAYAAAASPALILAPEPAGTADRDAVVPVPASSDPDPSGPILVEQPAASPSPILVDLPTSGPARSDPSPTAAGPTPTAAGPTPGDPADPSPSADPSAESTPTAPATAVLISI